MDNFRKDYILFIKNIEKKYEVNSYLVNGVKIWPILRNILFEIVSRHREYSLKQKIYEKLINLKLKNVKREPQGKSPIFDFASKEDILFISDDHFYIKSHSRYSNKYLDPIFEELSKLYKVKKLHLSTQLSGKKNIISYQIQNKSNSEIINIGLDVLNFLDQLKKEVRNSKFKNINVDNLEFTLKQKLEDINEGKNFIEDLVVKPQYIFYSSYTHPFKFGVNIASKLHKIKTIDVQHGIQGKNNPDYTNWTRVPNEKYEMLPDWFWTWNEVSKKRIQKDMKFKIYLVPGGIEREIWIKKKFKNKRVIYMGDGIFDSLIMKNFFYSISPNNSDPETKKNSNFVTKRDGGDRAVSEAVKQSS